METARRVAARRLEETIHLGKYGGYEKAKPKGTVQPWELFWTDTGRGLHVGLFVSEDAALQYRKR